ncbi:putative metal-dependent hydrolase [Cohnella sp. NL03-T5]|uniref:Metal-dependent hydrolase n=2 Tax=Cohnella silvisoli TaxID=2873699 RepID=A0ABV1KV67_9BACL|nr:putative metal-dependent hydrolase [Cohnella silvisoli]MCD9023107.1 putative metal-dependent hydrolase [Cohnella silvisoli]
MDDLEKSMYPIGKFEYDGNVSPEQRQQRIDELAQTAARLRNAVEGLSDTQLDTPYRPGGWTVRQVVHHVADASMNGFIRAKLALTEQQPLVKTFEENDWVELADTKQLPVEPSLKMLEGIHERMDALLRSLPPESFSIAFRHPDSGLNPLDRLLAYFAWHGKQHAAHITSLRQREGW